MFYEHLCTAMEAAILTFAAGAMFLSLETFEVSLLLMAMAGAIPHATRQLLTPTTEAPKMEPMGGDVSPALAP